MASASTPLPFKKVIIIGAGFSGLAMACQIKRKLNCDIFVMYNRASGFGGTWQANACMYNPTCLGHVRVNINLDPGCGGHPRYVLQFIVRFKP
jgi:cation diffusion facilitator CzcD-associated flavoprotein CzcO